VSSEVLTAYVNGEFVPMAEAMVHIEDRGFQFADGVYEVVACFGGNFLDLDRHLLRLQRSLDAVAISAPCTDAELRRLLAQIHAKNPFCDSMVYIQVTRGVAARSHLVTSDLTPTLVLTARKLPVPSDTKLTTGASGITLEDIRWKRCDIKSIALLASVLGKQEARRAGADETFWLDAEQHVLEGCATNLLAVIDGVLVTHPLDHQVLGGITRQMALELAPTLGIAVAERAWKLSEAGITECMLTSTTNAVMPVCRMDGVAIGNGRPGPIALQLRKAMCAQLAQLSAQGAASA